MAIVMEANYSKKLGLPGYSSHQYSITIRTELADLRELGNESGKLYALLQASVDREIQNAGFLPENGRSNGAAGAVNGHGRNGHSRVDNWNCSDKQRDLIQNIVAEHNLDKRAVDQLAHDRFGKPVRSLDKLEASGLIDELLEKHGGSRNGGGGGGRYQRAGAR